MINLPKMRKKWQKNEQLWFKRAKRNMDGCDSCRIENWKSFLSSFQFPLPSNRWHLSLTDASRDSPAQLKIVLEKFFVFISTVRSPIIDVSAGWQFHKHLTYGTNSLSLFQEFYVRSCHLHFKLCQVPPASDVATPGLKYLH